MKFFSASTGGFYDTNIHGTRTMMVPDPDWVRPTKEIPVVDEGGKPVIGDDGEEVFEAVPDMDAEHPLVEVENPDCRLPADAIQISEELHRSLMEAQARGKVIRPGEGGVPEAVDPPEPTDEELAARMIRERDRLLASSDWTQLADAPCDKAAWADYRRQLRDLPVTEGFPHINMPSPPEA